MPEFPFCLSYQETYKWGPASKVSSSQMTETSLLCSSLVFLLYILLSIYLIASDYSGASEVDRIEITNFKKSAGYHPGIKMCLGQSTPTLVLTDWALHGSRMDLCKVYQGHLESLKHPFSFYLSFVPPDHVKV